MDFTLKNIPRRTAKPRSYGLTMVMDKGMGLVGARDFLSVAAPYVDIIKLGFGTSYVTNHLREKNSHIYREPGYTRLFRGHTV